jgi:hypothetical protein
MDVKNPGIVSVADQGYPPAPASAVAASLPIARDVLVTGTLPPPRARATHRPRAVEIVVDPQARPPAGESFRVVGSAGTVAGRLDQGPGPVSAAAPSRAEICVVPPPDPAALGHYTGPEIARDQRPTGVVPDFHVVGGAGSVAEAARAGQDVLGAPSRPVSEIYLVPPAVAAQPGHYRGPDQVASSGVEILPPVIEVWVADQVIGCRKEKIS